MEKMGERRGREREGERERIERKGERRGREREGEEERRGRERDGERREGRKSKSLLVEWKVIRRISHSIVYWCSKQLFC